MNDLIIDCFAGGGGASVGIEMALGRPVDIAINHDSDAILMHKTNHPDTLHLTEDIFKVDLKKYVESRNVALMWASPDCTSHSKAKGGKPREKGLRILPWAVYKHAKAILPDVIIMENVEEIQQWGPLDEKGHPVKERRGEDYEKFITAMKSLGYAFDSRELVAADYGAPTTRKRWYAIFRRDGKEIVWPTQTHNKEGSNGLKPWEPIWKYLDLNDYGRSIFGRKKPLAEKTMSRIAKGLGKFIFQSDTPFIVPVKTHAVREADKSMRKQHMAAMSFLTKFYKSGTGQTMQEPLHTITTSPGHFGQVSMLAVNRKELLRSGVDEETAQKCTWVSQFIMEYYGCGTGQAISGPLHTIVSKDRFALMTIFGNQYVILDIFLRMLNPEELKRGQGFPEDYIIDRDYTWKPYPISKQVARIGNSVVPIMAQKLVEANCPYLKVGERVPNLRVDDSQPQLKFA